MFKKLHFKIEFVISYIRKKYIFFLLGALIGSTVFFSRNYIFYLYSLPIFHTRYVGVEGLYTVNNLPEDITNKITYGLTINTENDKSSLSPLVSSYDVQNSNKDYIFTLNPNVYWHNGKKFTAYDINYQIKGLNITPISDNQVKISMEKEFSPILSVLSKPLLKKKLVGLGQYKVQSITYQEGYLKTLKLVPNSDNNPSLLYHFYQSEKDLIDAYKLGDVDEIEISQLPPELSAWNKAKVTQDIKTNKRYIAVFLNTKKFTNKQLRQALAYATPKPKDKTERCLGPISPSSWAYNSNTKEYAYNPTRAKELFDKNKIDKINLAVIDRKLLAQAEEIKNEWKSILNIETTITIENQIDFENFDAILSYGGIPHDPDQYLFWHSTQTQTNLTKIDNSRIDKLLEEGRQVVDQQERKKIYQDFQKFLLEESPTIFISYPTIYTVSRIN